jgi:hypothetical protein
MPEPQQKRAKISYLYFDDDDDTQAVKEEQQRRHKQNINRLVRLAKQHQNGFETWLAGREPSNTKSITRSLNAECDTYHA